MDRTKLHKEFLDGCNHSEWMKVHKTLSHYNDRPTEFYCTSYQDNYCTFAPGQGKPGALPKHEFPPYGVAKDKYRITGVLGCFVHPQAITDKETRPLPPEGTAAAAGIAARMKEGGTLTANEKLKLELLKESTRPAKHEIDVHAKRPPQGLTAKLPFYRPGYGA